MAVLSARIANTRLKFALPHIKGDVLDIGCQRGQLYEYAGDQMTSYTGIDLNQSVLEQGRKAHPECQFHEVNIDTAPLEFSAAFDSIVMLAVIEHVFNLNTLGHSIAKALKPGGSVILTTPTPFGNDIIHAMGARIGLFSKDAADDHIAIFNKKRLEIFAAEFDLTMTTYKQFQLGCNQLAILTKSH